MPSLEEKLLVELHTLLLRGTLFLYHSVSRISAPASRRHLCLLITNRGFCNRLICRLGWVSIFLGEYAVFARWESTARGRLRIAEFAIKTSLVLVEVEKLINCVLSSSLRLFYNWITDALTTLVQEVYCLIHGCLAARLIVEVIVPDQLVLLG